MVSKAPGHYRLVAALDRWAASNRILASGHLARRRASLIGRGCWKSAEVVHAALGVRDDRQRLEALGDHVDGALLALDVAVDDERRRASRSGARNFGISPGDVITFIRP